MFSCVNLSFENQDDVIFSNLSLSLLSGSIYLLKGPNGSGKTSLLKIIARLMNQTSGEILWNNKPIELNQYYKYCVSYIGHENAVKNDLSVIDNLELWARIKSNQELILPAMAQFKLIELADVKCKDLSAGWKKRVALARMIISNGKLWLLDEPETHLDQEGKDLLLKFLQIKISSGGMAIIASHNVADYNKIPHINMEDFKC